MVAAAGAGMAAVDHELVGAEPRMMRVVVEAARVVDRLAPVGDGLDVDFDHAGIGRHHDEVDARIARRRVAFDLDLEAEFGGGRLNRRQQFEIILQPFGRRHEHADALVAHFDRHRGAHRRAGAAGRSCARGLRGAGRWRQRRRGLVADRCAGLRAGEFLRQRRAFGEGIGLDGMRVIGRLDMRQRLQRQPEADRRVAGDQEQPAAPRVPQFAQPAGPALRLRRLHRQHESGRVGEVALIAAQDAVALGRIVDFRIGRIDVRAAARLP